MRAVFADTYFFLALLDSAESRHAEAVQAIQDALLCIVTTEWVLAEFGDAYCHEALTGDRHFEPAGFTALLK